MVNEAIMPLDLIQISIDLAGNFRLKGELFVSLFINRKQPSCCRVNFSRNA